MSNWVEKAIDLLKKHEGFREYAYPDPLSHLGKTARYAGFGFKPAEQIIKVYKFNPKDGEPWTIGYGFTEGVTYKDGPMSKEKAEGILAGIVNTKYIPDLVDLAKSRKIDFNTLPEKARIALLNMIYAMGKTRLSRFSEMWSALSRRDFLRASSEILRSLWASSQAPNRAKEIAALMAEAGGEDIL